MKKVLVLAAVTLITLSVTWQAAACPSTQYSTGTGSCCQLCSAGTFKAADCTVDGGAPVCSSCEENFYTDMDNHDETCSICSLCRTNEVVEQGCTSSTDTVCKCADGYREVELVCELADDGDNYFMVLVLVIVGIAVLASSAAALYICRKRNGQCVCCKTPSQPPVKNQVKIDNPERRVFVRSFDDSDLNFTLEADKDDVSLTLTEDRVSLTPSMGISTLRRSISTRIREKKAEESAMGTVWEAMDRNMSELRRLICSDPPCLLNELLSRKLISHQVHRKAASISDRTERSEYLLRRFVDGGGEECLSFMAVFSIAKENSARFRVMMATSRRCSPTVDANSASPWLRVSRDHKMVTYSWDAQNLAAHPARFDGVCTQALCSENFPSGRHYWEVDVESASFCRIGVAYVTIPRRGEGRSGLLGENDASWCVRKCNSEYTAFHAGVGSPVSVQVPMRRVVVHVDCEAGIVSFFCGETLALLHSFQHSFTQPLYPGLYLNKTGSVSICAV
ncbi:unnamed protein product [Lampetra fluviatilis]